MTADLTREQARDRVALVIAAQRYHYGAAAADRDADAALTVLWPVVESLRADVDAYRAATVELLAAIASLKAELAHAHTVIARHVEPLRKPCRPEAGDCCAGSAHAWPPSESSRLPDCGPAAAPVSDQGSGRVEMRGKEDHG